MYRLEKYLDNINEALISIPNKINKNSTIDIGLSFRTQVASYLGKVFTEKADKQLFLHSY